MAVYFLQFTIYDFVDAHHRFLDPEWDGEPADLSGERSERTVSDGMDDELTLVHETDETPETASRRKLKIKLADGKEREIQHMVSTLYFDSNGQPMSAQKFLESLYGTLT